MAQKLIPMAICYDFDGTLSPGNMQEYDFMKMLGVKDPKKFWEKTQKLAQTQNADEVSAYMKLMIDESNRAGVPFTRETFINYGKTVKLYKGVETWFDRITKYAKSKGINLKHYIISSGIKEMIEGTKISKYFSKIFASSFMYDPNGVACWPAVVLNYTSKTQFLFRINKGCEDISDNKMINEYKPLNERPMPFTNMIYIGDGDTDVPCMKMIKAQGGHSIAVYKPSKGAKDRAQHLIRDDRVNVILPADYSEGKPIERFIKAIIDKIAADSAITRFKL